MKILMITMDNPPVTLGGIQSFIRNMSNLYSDNLLILSNKVKINKKFKVSEDLKNVLEVYSNNIILRGLNKLFKNKLRKLFVIKNIKNINPDICILSSYNELQFVKDIDTKVILVQHTISDRYLFHTENDKFFEAISEKSPDNIICLSEKDRKKFNENLNDKNIKLRVIRFPNTIKIFNNKKIKNSNLIILSRLENSAKRLDLAIKAMKKLPDFTLNIYGEGPAESFYKEIIKKENLKNVFLKGKTNKIQEKLDESAIYVITSDFEGYPVSSIEAMRRGLPIIIRDTFGAASDIVVDNKNGILLEKEWNEDRFVEAVRKVYDNYEYYSENSKKLGERYSPEIVKKEWDNLFEELINEKRR